MSALQYEVFTGLSKGVAQLPIRPIAQPLHETTHPGLETREKTARRVLPRYQSCSMSCELAMDLVISGGARAKFVVYSTKGNGSYAQ
jgi:hypothetical protein